MVSATMPLRMAKNRRFTACISENEGNCLVSASGMLWLCGMLCAVNF